MYEKFLRQGLEALDRSRKFFMDKTAEQEMELSAVDRGENAAYLELMSDKSVPITRRKLVKSQELTRNLKKELRMNCKKLERSLKMHADDDREVQLRNILEKLNALSRMELDRSKSIKLQQCLSSKDIDTWRKCVSESSRRTFSGKLYLIDSTVKQKDSKKAKDLFQETYETFWSTLKKQKHGTVKRLCRLLNFERYIKNQQGGKKFNEMIFVIKFCCRPEQPQIVFVEPRNGEYDTPALNINIPNTQVDPVEFLGEEGNKFFYEFMRAIEEGH